jgi:hypothetical protein
MVVRPIECMAVFHDRERMGKAVRGLVENGMPSNRIRVSQRAVGARPDRGSLLAFGVAIGAMTGAALTLVWMSWLNELVAIPLALIIHRIANGAASGGILGALLAVIVLAAHRKDRYELDTKADDFLVTVRSPSATVADDVCRFLALRGGDLVATSFETRAKGLARADVYRQSERSAAPQIPSTCTSGKTSASRPRSSTSEV